MTDTTILTERRGHILIVTINRPEARNALNNAVRTGLFDAVRRFNDDDAAKVLVSVFHPIIDALRAQR